jgi:hypothetical protein
VAAAAKYRLGPAYRVTLSEVPWVAELMRAWAVGARLCR